MSIEIVCLVEGHGEVEAVPILLKRIGASFDPPVYDLLVPQPIKISKSRLLQPGEIERAANLAAVKTSRKGGILVILDADDDCPADLGDSLLRRVQESQGDLPSAVVLAKSEFEAWFLAGAESLRGIRSLPIDLSRPDDPESIRGAKEWLSSRMPSHRNYRETLDQAALADSIDLPAVHQHSRSFRKLYKEVARLCSEVEALQ